jgi:hypothetical protein
MNARVISLDLLSSFHTCLKKIKQASDSPKNGGKKKKKEKTRRDWIKEKKKSNEKSED